MADSEALDNPMPDAEPRHSPHSPEADGEPSSSEDEAVVPMVVARERRANAGNRMGQLLRLAGEEDNQNLEAYGEIFQEAVDDVEFQADDDQDADVNMESSSEEDEDEGGQDDLQGEKELKAAERKSGGNKRKRAAFLDSAMKRATARQIPHAAKPSPASVAGSASGSLADGRPRKKSERVSWLPEEEEGPKRASSRQLSVQNKEMVHSRLKEKEKHRLRTVAIMKAAEMRKEARKPKVLTQAQRLQEAAATEKANSKSLHKWETAEKKREEEQAARLAALKNRKLEGPIISYWSGPSLWVNGKLKGTGKAVLAEVVTQEASPSAEVVEEAAAETKPAKVSKEKTEPAAETAATTATSISTAPVTTTPSVVITIAPTEAAIVAPTAAPTTACIAAFTTNTPLPSASATDTQHPPASTTVTPPRTDVVLPLEVPPKVDSTPQPVQVSSNPEPNGGVKSTLPDVIQPPAPSPETPLVNSQPQPTASVQPHEPPNFIDELHSYANLPPEVQRSTIPPSPPPQPTATVPAVPTAPTAPPAPKKQTREVAARTLIQLRDFFPEMKPRDKDAYMHHLCSWPSAPPKKLVPAKKTLCVITGHPARYCDPPTALAYEDSSALKGIRRVMDGGSRWSTLLGGYAGPRYGEVINKSVTFGRPAQGVPEGFWKKKVVPIEPKVEVSG